MKYEFDPSKHVPRGADPVQTVLSRLKNVKQYRSGWIASCPCPGHGQGNGDKNPSLSISRGNGRVLVCCQAGCSFPDVIDALGLTKADLRECQNQAPARIKPQGNGNPKKIGTEDGIYRYRDRAGRPVYEVVRFRDPKTFRQRTPEGKWSTKGIPRVPYRLPELLAASPKVPVLIVEGEKDAERLAELGAIATCNPAGAGKWGLLDPEAVQEAFTGREVVVIADNDKPGRDHAQDVAERLRGIAERVRVIRTLPGCDHEGADVSDWIDAGHGAGDLMRLVDSAEEPQCRESRDDQNTLPELRGEPAQPPPPPSPIESAWAPLPADWVSDCPPKRRYLVTHPGGDGLLPLGKAATLSSAGGVGKTMAIVQLAISVNTGVEWLGHFWPGHPVPPRVLLLLGEEDAEEAHRRIFNACDALGLDDTQRELVRDNLVVLPLAGTPTPLFQLDDDEVIETTHLRALRARLAEGEWGLIVLDPQSRFSGVDAEVSNALATRFVQGCEALTRAPGNPTVLVCAHSSKLSRRMNTADSRGVTALTDGFRWHATLTNKKDRVEFEVQKNNYAAPSDPLVLARRDNGLLTVETDAEREERELDDENEACDREDKKIQRENRKLDERITKLVQCARETPGLSKGQLVGKAGGKRTSMLAAVDAAVGQGLIENRGKTNAGAYYAVG